MLSSYMTPQEFLPALIGKWKGECSTWFEPGVLADVSAVEGEISALVGKNMLKHEYEGAIQGKQRHGVEWIAYNAIGNRFEIAWFDSFHMNYAILYSVGPAAESGFSVFGEYDVGEGHPRWGWRTMFRLDDPEHLVLQAYNVMPDGLEALAVEIRYHKVLE